MQELPLNTRDLCQSKSLLRLLWISVLVASFLLQRLWKPLRLSCIAQCMGRKSHLRTGLPTCPTIQPSLNSECFRHHSSWPRVQQRFDFIEWQVKRPPGVCATSLLALDAEKGSKLDLEWTGRRPTTRGPASVWKLCGQRSYLVIWATSHMHISQLCSHPTLLQRK